LTLNWSTVLPAGGLTEKQAVGLAAETGKATAKARKVMDRAIGTVLGFRVGVHSSMDIFLDRERRPEQAQPARVLSPIGQCRLLSQNRAQSAGS
jgi:hypothetical protein